MNEFNINKYVTDALKDIGIPIYFIARKEVNPPLIVFNITSERMGDSWDDTESITNYRISLNLFARGNYIEYKNKIIKSLLAVGFSRYDIPSGEYFEDIELYMQPMFFSFSKENY